MSAKDLDNQEMISISASWLDSKLGMFEGDDAPLKLMYPRLKQVHNRLVELDKRSRELEREERDFTDTIAHQNKLFDRLVSGIYWAFFAGSHLAQDPKTAKMYEEVSHAILPEGRSVTKNTFRSQAGAAIYSQERLTPEYIEFLGKIVFEDRTLYEEVVDMLDVAKLLAESLEQRAQLVALSNSAGRRKEERDAREDWIKVATDILTMSGILDISAEDKIRLRANYDDAEAAAVRRQKAKIAHQKKKKEKAKAKAAEGEQVVPKTDAPGEGEGDPVKDGEGVLEDGKTAHLEPSVPKKLIETETPTDN